MSQNEARRRLQKLYEFALRPQFVIRPKPDNVYHFNKRLTNIQSEYPADVIQRMKVEIDPDRRVFDRPLIGTEKGLHGYPVAHNLFHFLTSIYSNEVDQDADMPMALHNDFKEAMSELNCCGFFVKSKNAGEYGFLVVHKLKCETVPDHRSLRELGLELGVQFMPLAWLKSPCTLYYQDREHLALTAFIAGDAAAQAPHYVDMLLARLQQLERGWEISQKSV
jgi:hypothetical protein